MNENTEVGSQKSESKPTPRFAVGDKVTWAHSSSNGNSIRFQTREGTIDSLNGANAVCKMRNGKTFWIALDRITPRGQTTELTKMFQPDPA